MENSTFNIAMDLSNGLFAHHLYGVLKVMHQNGDLTPSVDEEAAEYLDVFHEGWREEDEEEEQALYQDHEPREDFGYFGELGLKGD